MKDEKAIVEIIIKGQQSNATVKQIEASARALSSQLKQLPTDSQKFIDKTKELQQVNGRLKSIRDEIKGVGNAFNNVKPQGFFDQVKTGAAAVFGGNLLMRGAQGVVNVFNDAIDVHRKFEASLQNLSAITGATGKDLEFYKEKAREMGATVNGGASAVVEAFKLIGSAKPELLENKEALAQVTDSAILLSKAAGLDLPQAATRLTDAMNQFGADASEAAKYVDVLAAGAKYGAAEIPDVTDALLKFGVAAKSSNINIQESVAAIELLGEKGLKGAEAGTQLRNVFAKLSATKILPPEAKAELAAAGIDLKKLEDKSIPLSERLKELSKIQGNAAGITRVFGLENKAAGEILVNNITRLEDLTKKVNENGSATEQAKTNTQTFDQALIEAKNAYEEMLLEITDGDFGEIIKGFVKVAAKEFGTLKEAAKSIGALFKGNFIESSEQSGRDSFFNKVKEDAEKMTEVKRKELVKQAADEVFYLNKQLQNRNDLSTLEIQNLEKMIASKSQFAQTILSIDKKISVAATDETKQRGEAEEALDKKTRKALLDTRKKFLEEIEALEKKYKQRFMSSQQIEEKELFGKYDKLLAQAKKGSADEAFLRQSLVAELTDIEKKYSDKAISEKEAFIAEYTKTIQSAEVNEIDESRKKYAKLIEQAQKYGEDIKPLLEQQKLEEANIRSKYSSDSSTSEKPNQFLGGGKSEWQTQLDEAISVYDMYASRVNGILDGVKANNTARAQNETEMNKLAMNEQLSREQRLLKSKIITQEDYDRRSAKLDQDRRAKDIRIKQEAAERNKKIAVFQATVSGAVSVAKTLAEYEYPYNLILAALDAAVVGVQISAIQNEPVPAFAKGGFSNNPSGYVNSPTVFSNSASGKPFLAGEAGSEFIIPNWMLQDPLIANNVEMLDAIRTRGYAGGGYNNSISTTNNTSSKSDTVMGWGDLAKVLTRLNEHLDNGIGVNYDQFNKTNTRIDSSKKAAQIG